MCTENGQAVCQVLWPCGQCWRAGPELDTGDMMPDVRCSTHTRVVTMISGHWSWQLWTNNTKLYIQLKSNKVEKIPGNWIFFACCHKYTETVLFVLKCKFLTFVIIQSFWDLKSKLCCISLRQFQCFVPYNSKLVSEPTKAEQNHNSISAWVLVN